MNEVEALRKDLIETIKGIEKDKLSLLELRQYAEIVKIVSEIQTKSYLEQMSETMSHFVCAAPKETIGSLKGVNENAV